MKKIYLITLLILAGIVCKACSYKYGINSDGKFNRVDNINMIYSKNFNQNLLENNLKSILSKSLNLDDIETYTSLLLQAGEVNEAILILEYFDNKYPNDYRFLSNLALANHVLGNYKNAKNYIERSIKYNPNSKKEGDWVHLKILEARIEYEQNQTKLTSNSVLQLSEENKKDQKIKNEILNQTKILFPFFNKPDQILSDVFISLGDCFASSTSIEYAELLYKISKNSLESTNDIIDTKLIDINKKINLYGNYELPIDEINCSSSDRIGILDLSEFILNRNKQNYNFDSKSYVLSIGEITRKLDINIEKENYLFQEIKGRLSLIIILSILLILGITFAVKKN